MQKTMNIVWVVLLIVGFVYILDTSMRKQDKIDTAHEKAMSKLARDQKGFDLNDDGTLADTLHNRELKRKH